MASCSTSLFASSAPMKIVPYVPRAQKPERKRKSKANPMATNNTAEHNYSGVSSSTDDEEWLHIDDLPMPDTGALRPLDPAVPAPSEAPDAFSSLDYDMLGGLGVASESEKPEHNPSDQESLYRGMDHATGIAKINSALDSLFGGSSLEEPPLVLGSDAAEEHHNITQTKPTNEALSCQGNGCHATTGTEGSHAEQDSDVNFDSISGPLAEGLNGVQYDEPLPAEGGLSPVEEEPPIDVDMMNKLLLTRKRTRRSPSDTIISLREVLDITLESELEDTHLAKRQRLSTEQEESIVPHHVPTPKPTFLPTPSSPGSSGSSNDGQDGGIRSPVPSSNNPDEEGDDDDDGAHAQGLVGKMSRKGINDQAEEIHEDYFGRVRMCGKSQARCFQQSKRISRLEGDHRPITRSQSTIPTRKSRNVTSPQLCPLSRPRSGSATRSFSPRTASQRKKARGRIDNDEHSAYQVTDLARVHVPEGSSILTAIVRSKSNLSLNPMVLNHELLGGEGQVIRITQLSPGSWMLLGYQQDNQGSSTSTRENPTLDITNWVSSPRCNPASYDTDQSNDEDEEYEEDLGNSKVFAAKSNIRCRQRTHENGKSQTSCVYSRTRIRWVCSGRRYVNASQTGRPAQ